MKLTILMFAILLLNTAYAQKSEVVIRMKGDKKQFTFEKIADGQNLKIKTEDKELRKIFDKYEILNFKQLYPSSEREELLKYYILTLDKGEGLVSELKNKHLDIIDYVRKNVEVKPLHTPNDFNNIFRVPSDGGDYNLNPRDISQSHLELINARSAWNITKGNSNFVIGMKDGRFNFEHEDLDGKLEDVYASVLEHEYYPEHGTWVASVLAGNTNNGVGVSSISYKCKFAATRYKNSLLDMAKDGIRVMNISEDWGGYNPDNQLLIDELVNDYGVTVVAAAGNDPTGEYVYPASYEGVISVTAVGHMTEYGDEYPYGWKDCHNAKIGTEEHTANHNDKVDISAPGYSIPVADSERGYTCKNGTSFSAPLVSGVCTLMYCVNPYLTPDRVEWIIKETADDIYGIPENEPYVGLLGAGRINTYSAVKKACTVYLSGLQRTNIFSTKYDIFLEDVIVDNSSTLELYAKKSIDITGEFYLPVGSTLIAEIK